MGIVYFVVAYLTLFIGSIFGCLVVCALDGEDDDAH